jgi:hypothetical protein
MYIYQIELPLKVLKNLLLTRHRIVSMPKVKVFLDSIKVGYIIISFNFSPEIYYTSRGLNPLMGSLTIFTEDILNQYKHPCNL